jgi:hypothetical protein
MRQPRVKLFEVTERVAVVAVAVAVAATPAVVVAVAHDCGAYNGVRRILTV